MNKRAQIVADLSKAATFDDQVRLVGELDRLDRQAVLDVQAARGNDWAEETVRQTLSPVRTHELHTASTEWLDAVDTSGSDYHAKIIAEAALWYERCSPEVKADDEEFTIQATGMVRRQASQYAESAPAAEAAALSYLSFLRAREGASGLPQIDQTVAPDGVTQQATPIPPDVFDNFAPEIDPINQGVSGTEDSNRAPLLQENGPGTGAQETLHSEAPVTSQPDNSPPHTASVAINHVMNMDQFRLQQAREAAAATDPRVAAKTAADGDSSQTDDRRFPGGVGSTDQDGSAAMDRLVEATGLSAEEVRQRFPNPQEAVKVIDSLGDSKKAASKTAGRVCSPCTNGNHSGTNGTPGCSGGDCACTAAGCGKNSGGGTGKGNKEASLQVESVFHEWYGEVSRPQLAAYRKHNISPSDHDDLVRHFGNDPAAITKWVKDQAAEKGMVSTYNLGRDDHWAAKEAASGLDQIQQTTAPDGVTERPTPLPGDVAFPLIDQTEMSSEQLVDPDTRAAVDKAAALNEHNNTCRSCGQNLSTAASSKTSSGEDLYTCASCGTKNYLQRAASLSFTPDDAMAHPEFFKGYGFGRNWRTGGRLVRAGTPEFEAGLYAGITDNPGHQAGWLAAHAKQAAKAPEFGSRIAMHDRFTQKVASTQGLRTTAAYVVAANGPEVEVNNTGKAYNDRLEQGWADGTEHFNSGQKPKYKWPEHGDEYMRDPYVEGYIDSWNSAKHKQGRKMATTETDLATTSPGTSPSPVGDTPINGPGRPGPLAGYEEPAAAGGPAPYNGAEPLGHPVVPGAISPAPIVAPEVTHSGPPNPFANQQTVAFRRRVQAGLIEMLREE